MHKKEKVENDDVRDLPESTAPVVLADHVDQAARALGVPPGAIVIKQLVVNNNYNYYTGPPQ